MIVTRQSNYYDGGAYSVEIAAELDYAGPGALSKLYSGDFAEEDDPRELAEVAIQLRKDWINNNRSIEYIPFTLSMNGILYATVNDGLTASGLRRWAKEQYEKLPKCDYCGELAGSRSTYQSYDTFASEVVACSEYHAELLLQDESEDKDDDV